jgi:hypothetical protein
MRSVCLQPGDTHGSPSWLPSQGCRPFEFKQGPASSPELCASRWRPACDELLRGLDTSWESRHPMFLFQLFPAGVLPNRRSRLLQILSEDS